MQNLHPRTIQPETGTKEKIRVPILVPLFTSILLLLGIFTLAVYNLQQQHITGEVRARLESTRVGLTLVKKIVEIYGGKIWLTSKAGEGATFFFTLPKQPAER